MTAPATKTLEQDIADTWAANGDAAAMEPSARAPAAREHHRPLSVLVVTNTYPTEETPEATPCIRDQIEAMRERFGVAVEVLHINGRDKRNYLRAALRMLASNLGPRRHDLVHAHYGHSAWVARLQLRCPLVVTFHGSDLLSGRERWLGRLIARWVDAVILMSQQMKAVSGRPDAEVIPFGVDRRVFYPMPKAQARAALGLAARRFYVLFPYDPARAVKRYDRLAAAVARLEARGWESEILVARGQSRERMRLFMSAADAMALTSDHEGSPMAVREALACGLPVVSVAVGDLAELLGEVDGCHLAEPTPEDIANKLEAVFTRGERLDLGGFAPALDAGAAAARVVAAYQRLLGLERAACRWAP